MNAPTRPAADSPTPLLAAFIMTPAFAMAPGPRAVTGGRGTAEAAAARYRSGAVASQPGSETRPIGYPDRDRIQGIYRGAVIIGQAD